MNNKFERLETFLEVGDVVEFVNIHYSPEIGNQALRALFFTKEMNENAAGLIERVLLYVQEVERGPDHHITFRDPSDHSITLFVGWIADMLRHCRREFEKLDINYFDFDVFVNGKRFV